MNFSNDIPDLTEAQFRKFAALIHELASINLKDSKITLLSNRLRKRLRHLQMADFDTYYDYLARRDRESMQEMVHFIEVVTTNESYFWRTTNNYELLKQSLLPRLLQQFRGETLRFWSAGSSTGEEPYNLAMELVESMKEFGVFDFKILASDISKRVVEFAREGRYTGRKIERVPPMILSRYFRPDSDDSSVFIVRDDIKQRIEFKVENIFAAEPAPRHMIFCRNVMIYFSKQDQEKLSNHFYRMLKPGGFLILGHSESLHMMNTPFKAIHFDAGVAYSKQA